MLFYIAIIIIHAHLLSEANGICCLLAGDFCEVEMSLSAELMSFLFWGDFVCVAVLRLSL